MKANQFLQELKEDRTAYAKAVSGLIGILLIIVIGVIVFYRLIEAADTEGNLQGTVRNQSNVSMNATTSMAGTIFSILPLIALIVLAMILMAVILGLGK